MTGKSTQQANGDAARDALDTANADHSALTEAPEPPSWALTLRAPTGCTNPKGVPSRELLAVACWVNELESALAAPADPKDVFLLGSVGRHMLLNLRLSREVFRATKAKGGGEIKASVSELRASTRLVADLLARLKFKSSRVPKGPDMRDSWSST